MYISGSMILTFLLTVTCGPILLALIPIFFKFLHWLFYDIGYVIAVVFVLTGGILSSDKEALPKAALFVGKFCRYYIDRICAISTGFVRFVTECFKPDLVK